MLHEEKQRRLSAKAKLPDGVPTVMPDRVQREMRDVAALILSKRTSSKAMLKIVHKPTQSGAVLPTTIFDFTDKANLKPSFACRDGVRDILESLMADRKSSPVAVAPAALLFDGAARLKRGNTLIVGRLRISWAEIVWEAEAAPSTSGASTSATSSTAPSSAASTSAAPGAVAPAASTSATSSTASSSAAPDTSGASTSATSSTAPSSAASTSAAPGAVAASTSGASTSAASTKAASSSAASTSAAAGADAPGATSSATPGAAPPSKTPSKAPSSKAASSAAPSKAPSKAASSKAASSKAPSSKAASSAAIMASDTDSPWGEASGEDGDEWHPHQIAAASKAADPATSSTAATLPAPTGKWKARGRGQSGSRLSSDTQSVSPRITEPGLNERKGKSTRSHPGATNIPDVVHTLATWCEKPERLAVEVSQLGGRGVFAKVSRPPTYNAPRTTSQATRARRRAASDYVVSPSNRRIHPQVAYTKGDLLTKYDGVDCSRAQVCSIFPQTHINQTEGLYVDGLRTPVVGRGVGSFVNHSVNANAKCVRMEGAVVIVATKGIKVGAEVTINYGTKECESYKVAMGEARLVATARSDGSLDVTCHPTPKHGATIRHTASNEWEVVEQLARDLHAVAKDPSHDAQGCFHRCVAMALRTDLLTRPEEALLAIRGEHRERAMAYVDGVDVKALLDGKSEFRSVKHMRATTAAFVQSLGDAWSNQWNPADSSGSTTVGATLVSLAYDEIPDVLSEIVSSKERVLAEHEEPEEEHVARERMAAALTARTADCGELAFRLISFMFGVDLHIFDITRCVPTSLLDVYVLTAPTAMTSCVQEPLRKVGSEG